MQTSPAILHLIDDTTPGGVMRVLDHITSCPLMARIGTHSVLRVTRGKALPRANADIVVSHLALSWQMLPRLISFRSRHPATPLVHVEHSYTEAFTALNVPAKGRFLTMLRTSYALFNRVVAVSNAQAEWLVRRGLVRGGALHTIQSAVDLTAFRAMPAPFGQPVRFGAIGRLEQQKGFDLLIDAFRALKRSDTELHIFGTGAEDAALRIRAGKDSRIHFHGHAQSPCAAMEAVDMVAMPSRWEAFGLVALEARAAGRPLALSQTDGLIDQAVEGTVVVRSHSLQEWVSALEGLLEVRDTTQLRRSCDTAEAEFARKWCELIASLVTVETCRRGISRGDAEPQPG